MIETNLFKNIFTKEYHIILLYVESKIWHKQAYLQNRNIFRDIENRFMVAKGEWRWERDVLGVWD